MNNTQREKLNLPAKIKTPEELGRLIRRFRMEQAMNQADIVGLANTGNRFIVELEKGKPTLQLKKVLEVIDLLGLEVVIQKKDSYL
jgi:HTH-type transcriptional regulator / antitoxin HipB